MVGSRSKWKRLLDIWRENRDRPEEKQDKREKQHSRGLWRWLFYRWRNARRNALTNALAINRLKVREFDLRLRSSKNSSEITPGLLSDCDTVCSDCEGTKIYTQHEEQQKRLSRIPFFRRCSAPAIRIHPPQGVCTKPTPRTGFSAVRRRSSIWLRQQITCLGCETPSNTEIEPDFDTTNAKPTWRRNSRSHESLLTQCGIAQSSGESSELATLLHVPGRSPEHSSASCQKHLSCSPSSCRTASLSSTESSLSGCSWPGVGGKDKKKFSKTPVSKISPVGHTAPCSPISGRSAGSVRSIEERQGISVPTSPNRSITVKEQFKFYTAISKFARNAISTAASPVVKRSRSKAKQQRLINKRSYSFDISSTDIVNHSSENASSVAHTSGLPIKNTMSPSSSGLGSKSSLLARQRSGDSEIWIANDAPTTPSSAGTPKKYKNHDYDVNDLFQAVEMQSFDRVEKIIMENANIDLNRPNDHQMFPLDIALLNNNVPLIQLLRHYGAVLNPEFIEPSIRTRHLDSLHIAAQRQIDLLTQRNNHGSPEDRFVANLQKRVDAIIRMKSNFRLAQPPGAPVDVRLFVSSHTSLLLEYREPIECNGSYPVLYKIEWIEGSEFPSSSCNSATVGLPLVVHESQTSELHFELTDLQCYTKYAVRVSAANVKGFGPYTCSHPSTLAPSSWQDALPANDLVLKSKTSEHLSKSLSTILEHLQALLDSPTRSMSKKGRLRKVRTIFSSPRFVRPGSNPGLFVSLLFYSEDKILLTGDDFLPTVEVDIEDSIRSVNVAELHYWLLKLSCDWKIVHSLIGDFDKLSTPSFRVRAKMLAVLEDFQSCLQFDNLGVPHSCPHVYNDCITLVMSLYVAKPKDMNLNGTRWVKLKKFDKQKIPDATPTPTVAITAKIPEMIAYHDRLSMKLSRGLYLAYLKLYSSMNTIEILVPRESPCNLPCIRIRSCPHVSKEEWEYIVSLNKCDDLECQELPSVQQQIFLDQLTDSCRHMLECLDISADDQALRRRIYDMEIVTLTEETTLILLLPPPELVCNPPGMDMGIIGSQDDESQSNFMTVPLSAFSFNHLRTYDPKAAEFCAHISNVLEVQEKMANQQWRESLSMDEVSSSRDRCDQLADFQKQLDELYRKANWLQRVINNARDKRLMCGVYLSFLFATCSFNESSKDIGLPDGESLNSLDTVDVHTVSNHNNNEINTSKMDTSGSQSHTDEGSDVFSSERSVPPVADSSHVTFDSVATSLTGRSSPSFFPELVDEYPPFRGSVSSSVNNNNRRLSVFSGSSSRKWSGESAVDFDLRNFSLPVGQATLSTGASISTSPSIRRASSPRPDLSRSRVIRVFAAFDTPLRKRITVRLHILERTTAREIIRLVLEQVNKSLLSQNLDPLITEEKEFLFYSLFAVKPKKDEDSEAFEQKIAGLDCPLRLKINDGDIQFEIRPKNGLLHWIKITPGTIV